jgi:hypothetical protein
MKREGANGMSLPDTRFLLGFACGTAITGLILSLIVYVCFTRYY